MEHADRSLIVKFKERRFDLIGIQDGGIQDRANSLVFGLGGQVINLISVTNFKPSADTGKHGLAFFVTQLGNHSGPPQLILLAAGKSCEPPHSVSARLVADATRVLKVGDELLVEAIRLGEVTVSDAASVLDLPKEQQREAVSRVRSGDARTLRQAAKQLSGPPLDAKAKPAMQSRELRRACQRFKAGYEKLFREIDNAAWACGGANAHTNRAHEALTAAQLAMQACLAAFGREARPK